MGVLDYLVFRDFVDDHEDAVRALLDRIAAVDDDALRGKGERITRMFEERMFDDDDALGLTETDIAERR